MKALKEYLGIIIFVALVTAAIVFLFSAEIGTGRKGLDFTPPKGVPVKQIDHE